MDAATLQKLEEVRVRLEEDISGIGRARDLGMHAAAQIKLAIDALVGTKVTRDDAVRDHWRALIDARKAVMKAAKALGKVHHQRFYKV